MILKVKVIPGSSRDQLVGWLGDAYKIKVQAPPEAGKANKAVIQLLAKTLAIPQKQITIDKGESNPEKLVRIEGLTKEQVLILLKQKTPLISSTNRA